MKSLTTILTLSLIMAVTFGAHLRQDVQQPLEPEITLEE